MTRCKYLGTTQMELSGGGWPVWQGQFTPFGKEIVAGNTLLPTSLDGSSMPFKFTGKERDTESGLDYFGARNYASSMGRWMSPDWADKPEAVPYSSLDNPQSLNLYGYVLNNPLSRADPDGHCCDTLMGLAKEFYNQTVAPALNLASAALKAPARLMGQDVGGAYHGELKASNADQAETMAAVAPGVTMATMLTGEGEGAKAVSLADDAIVVRGGMSSVESLEKAVGTHPSGVTGVSVESAPGKSAAQLAGESPTVSKYGQIRCCTVGDVRKAGGDVVPTSGQSPNHATMTGLTPQQMNQVLKPPVPNPAKVPKQ